MGAKNISKESNYVKNDKTHQSVAAQGIDGFLVCRPRNSFSLKNDKNYQVEPNLKRLRDKAFTDWPQAIAWEFRPQNRKNVKTQTIGKKVKRMVLAHF